MLVVVESLALAAPSAAQAVRERVSVNDVSVWLTGTDHAGRPIGDLRASELTLLVDGAPFPIDSLSAPLPSASTVGSAVSGTPPEPLTARQVPHGAASDAVYIGIFIDENDTVAFDRRDVVDELLRFVNSPRESPARFMLARFDGVNTQVLCPWTDERTAMARALSTLRKHPHLQLFTTESGRGGTSSVWLRIYRARFRKALLEMLAGFPEMGADRQLLLGTGGLALLGPLDVAEKLYGQQLQDSRADAPGSPHAASKMRQSRTEQSPAAQQSEGFQLWSRAVGSDTDALTTDDVLAKALERRIRLIPIAMEALDRGVNPGVDSKDPHRPSAGDGNLSSRMGSAQILTEVADRTGGTPILVPRNAAALLAEVEGRPAYALSFRDPSSGDHAYHSIEIKCQRPGVRLSYRRGYRFATDDEQDLDRAVSGLLHAENNDPPFPLLIQLSPVQGRTGQTITRVTIRFTPPRESIPSAEREITVLGMGEDPKGNRTQPIRWTGVARRSSTDPYAYEATFDLGIAGTYRWSLSVRDLSLGLTAFVLARV